MICINIDQKPLSYVSLGKYTFCLKGSTTVPIKGVDDKPQITATFTVSVTIVLLIQLIIKVDRKDFYQNTNFQTILTLPTPRTTGRISKNASICFKRLYSHIYE